MRTLAVHLEVGAHLEVGQVVGRQEQDPEAEGMPVTNVENPVTLQIIAQALSLVVVGGDEDEAYPAGQVEEEEGARQRVVAQKRGTLQPLMIIKLSNSLVLLLSNVALVFLSSSFD
jgi:hypothetical protein